MAVTYYAGPDGHGQIELAVDDPGHGYLHARLRDGTSADMTLVAGARVAEMLADITTGVLGNETTAWVGGLGLLTVEQCRALLPAAQKAIALAVGGTDRYERVYTVLEARGDLPALCVDCNQGSDFAEKVTISSQCIEFGHHPFGVGPDARWTD